MSETFKLRHITNLRFVVVVIVVVLGNDRARFESNILEHRSGHVTTAQTATHKSTKRNSTKHTSRFRWVRLPLGSVVLLGSVVPLDSVVPFGFVLPLGSVVPLASVTPLGSVGCRCSVGSVFPSDSR